MAGPTSLGFASGLVAGLVAITPGQRFCSTLGGDHHRRGGPGLVCYWAVLLKGKLGV